MELCGDWRISPNTPRKAHFSHVASDLKSHNVIFPPPPSKPNPHFLKGNSLTHVVSDLKSHNVIFPLPQVNPTHIF